MLDELLTFAADFDFEEGGATVALESVTWAEHFTDLILSATCGDKVNARWCIRCSKIRDMNLKYSSTSRLELVDDHVLLWPYTLLNIELFYRGQCRDRLSAIGAIVETHRQLVGKWFNWERFLNGPSSTNYLEGNFGIFASGPDRVIKAYESVLCEQGLETSCVPGNPPMWWDGTKWASDSPKLFVLFVGDSYVIAPSFGETRLM